MSDHDDSKRPERPSAARSSMIRHQYESLIDQIMNKARADGLHKLALDVFPHNEAAIALYRKHGFVEEGRRIKHYRRANGELWDSIVMGLLL